MVRKLEEVGGVFFFFLTHLFKIGQFVRKKIQAWKTENRERLQPPEKQICIGDIAAECLQYCFLVKRGVSLQQ